MGFRDDAIEEAVDTVPNIGAQIITNTIVRVLCYLYSIMGPKNPILVSKAAMLNPNAKHRHQKAGG